LQLYFEIQSTMENLKLISNIQNTAPNMWLVHCVKKSSLQWVEYFKENAKMQRVDWSIRPNISQEEKNNIIASVQAWQLGETSDGSHLLKAAGKYAKRIGDVDYLDAVKLFIKEEQKHGNNLGLYLDLINVPRKKKDWGDSLFRKVRYYNSSMEIWTIAVIIVESLAQLFYKSVKDSSNCILLKDICTDILKDEAPHIRFQAERLEIIFKNKSELGKFIAKPFYYACFYIIIITVWLGHSRAFKVGGNDFTTYIRRINSKFKKIMNRL